MGKDVAVSILKMYRDAGRERDIDHTLKKLAIEEHDQKLADFEKRVSELICALSYNEKYVVIGFYIQKKSWPAIAMTMRYSVRRCETFRDSALKKLCAMFEKDKTIKSFYEKKSCFKD